MTRLGTVWLTDSETGTRWPFYVETPTVPAPPPALSRGSEAGAGTPGAT